MVSRDNPGPGARACTPCAEKHLPVTISGARAFRYLPPVPVYRPGWGRLGSSTFLTRVSTASWKLRFYLKRKVKMFHPNTNINSSCRIDTEEVFRPHGTYSLLSEPYILEIGTRYRPDLSSQKSRRSTLGTPSLLLTLSPTSPDSWTI